MTSSIFHGIKTNLLQTGARPINPVSTAIIGMVCTASDADADIFPLDRPVLVADVRSAIGSAGTQGTLAKALATIADQCSPTVIVVCQREGSPVGAAAARAAARRVRYRRNCGNGVRVVRG